MFIRANIKHLECSFLFDYCNICQNTIVRSILLTVLMLSLAHSRPSKLNNVIFNSYHCLISSSLLLTLGYKLDNKCKIDLLILTLGMILAYPLHVPLLQLFGFFNHMLLRGTLFLVQNNCCAYPSHPNKRAFLPMFSSPF